MKIGLKNFTLPSFGKRLCLGIDITEEAVRGVLLSKKGKDLSILRWEEIPTPEDPEGLSPNAWEAALQKLLKHYSLPRVHVTVSLPSNRVFISRYHLPKVAAKSLGEKILVKLEENQLPIDLEDSTISFAELEDAPKGTYLTVCAERSSINPAISALQSAGVTSCYILPADISISKCLARQGTLEQKQAAAVLRLGATETILSFFDEEGFRLRRIIPIGREDLYQNLISSGLFPEKEKTPKEEVFQLLDRYPLDQEGQSKQGETGELEHPPERIHDIVSPVLGRLISSIQKTIHFYNNSIGKTGMEVLHLLDNFKGLNGIDRYLEERLQIRVQFLATLLDLPRSGKFKEEPASPAQAACFAPALGIALDEEEELSLIPREDMFLPRLRFLRTATRLTAGILSLCMILLSLFYYSGIKRLDETARNSDLITGKFQGFLQVERHFLHLKERNERYKKTIQDLLPPRGKILGVMKEVSRLHSSAVSLDQLEVNAEKGDLSLQLSGRFAMEDENECDSTQGKFVNSLEASPLLENISMTKKEWDEKGGYLISRFSLQAALSPDEKKDEASKVKEGL